MAYNRPSRRKYHFVYETKCKVTGKFYRGKHSTDNLDDGYLGSGRWICYGRKKYGDDRYERSILEFCESSEKALSREFDLVAEVLENPLCMNLIPGGSGGATMTGKKHSEETKQKMSKSSLGKPKSETHRQNWKAAQTFKPLSEETKAKMSASKKGKPKAPEHIEKIKARWEDPAYRERLVAIHKQKVFSDETRAKISQNRKGIAVSDDTKKKMAEAKLGSKWMNHPEHKTRLVPANQVNDLLAAGWAIGRKRNGIS